MTDDLIIRNANKMDLESVATFAENKGFVVTKSADTYSLRTRTFLYVRPRDDIARVDGAYTFIFYDWSPIVDVSATRIGRTKITVTPSFIEDAVTMRMIAERCWTGD